MAKLYLITIAFALWIGVESASTLAKKDFDLGEISDDPAVIDFVCEQICSDHNSAEKESYANILAELEKINTQLTALHMSSNPQPLPQSEVVPKEYKKVYPVYMMTSSSGNYRLTLQQARSKCQEDGSKLATRAQLEAAFQQGMDFCSCGWLEDGYAAFPIQYPRDGCFASQNAHGPGVRTGCSWQKTWNAWCFDKDKANKYHSNS